LITLIELYGVVGQLLELNTLIRCHAAQTSHTTQ